MPMPSPMGDAGGYSRFAVYYVPSDGAFARFGAAWLGWDIAAGAPAEHLDLPNLEDITERPRKYGFHATLKPPFPLAPDQSLDALQDACSTLAATLAPASCEGLAVTALGRFLALTPIGDTSGIDAIAAACVNDLDMYRAKPSKEELERRRKPHFSATQNALLDRWGYPHVMEAFRFHMTLTGRLPKSDLPLWEDRLAQQVPQDALAPFTLDAITLCGERADGRFEVIERYTLR